MERIESIYHDTGGKCYVSFSGGKDSTVILTLIKMCEEIYTLPRNAIPAVFCNTGIELGATVEFSFACRRYHASLCKFREYLDFQLRPWVDRLCCIYWFDFPILQSTFDLWFREHARLYVICSLIIIVEVVLFRWPASLSVVFLHVSLPLVDLLISIPRPLEIVQNTSIYLHFKRFVVK